MIDCCKCEHYHISCVLGIPPEGKGSNKNILKVTAFKDGNPVTEVIKCSYYRPVSHRDFITPKPKKRVRKKHGRVIQLSLYENTIINSFANCKEAAENLDYNYSSFVKFMATKKPRYRNFRWAYSGEWRDPMTFISYTARGKKRCFLNHKEASEVTHVHPRYVQKHCENKEKGFRYEIIQYQGDQGCY